MNVKKAISRATLSLCTLLVAGLTNAQTWSRLSTVGSPPVQEGYATYDAANNRMIVFFTGDINQVWVLTNANGLGGTPTWMQLTTTGNLPRGTGGGATLYDSTTNRLIYYGGCLANCGAPLSAVFLLSNANGIGGASVWSESTTNPTEPRASPSAIYNSATNRMVSFGGDLAFSGTAQNDTRVLLNANSGNSTWVTANPSGSAPGVRTTSTAVYDQSHNRMIIFGGADLGSPLSDYNDAWVLSNADGSGRVAPSWTQVNPQGAPPAVRRIHSAIYDSERNSMYVFGGLSDGQTASTVGDLWKLTNANGLGAADPKWTQIGQLGTPPGGLYAQSVVFDNANQRMIVYGGIIRGSSNSNDVFVLDLLQH